MKEEIIKEIEKQIKSLRWSNSKGRLDYELGLEKAIKIIKNIK